MRLAHGLRVIGAAGFAVVVGLALAFGLRASGVVGQSADSGDDALASPIRTKVVGSETHVVLSSQDMAAADIAVATLSGSEYQERVPAFATVMSPQALLEQRRTFQLASADVDRGEFAVKAARLEVQRLQPLHRDDRIVSDKDFQAAQVKTAIEETNLRLATDQLRLLTAEIRQRWGSVVGGWLVSGSPRLDRLIGGQDVLVQIVLSAGRSLDDAASVRLEATADSFLETPILSETTQSDPRFPGQGFWSVVPSNRRLLPGMSVPATVPTGPMMTGVVVPDSAIFHAQGQSWVYFAPAAGEFVRHPVDTRIATPKGYLVRSGLAAGTSVVVRGAQLLLSEELKAPSPTDDDKPDNKGDDK